MLGDDGVPYDDEYPDDGTPSGLLSTGPMAAGAPGPVIPYACGPPEQAATDNNKPDASNKRIPPHCLRRTTESTTLVLTFGSNRKSPLSAHERVQRRSRQSIIQISKRPML